VVVVTLKQLASSRKKCLRRTDGKRVQEKRGLMSRGQRKSGKISKTGKPARTFISSKEKERLAEKKEGAYSRCSGRYRG